MEDTQKKKKKVDGEKAETKKKTPSTTRRVSKKSDTPEEAVVKAPKKTVKKAKKPVPKVRVFALGGMSEIGKNMYVVEYQDDIIVVDCGIGFPDDDMLGIDLVMPDITYLIENESKIRGIFITHGHEDHIGSLPYVLSKINVPVWGTKLTLGIIKYRLEEFNLEDSVTLNCVEAGDIVKAGIFKIEYIKVNHSIADACCLAITTPEGVILHSGDFKLDMTPIEGEMLDITRLGDLGKKGIMLLMCESTNAEHHGYTPSERKVGLSFDKIFMQNPDKRFIIATFSSNVHRVQQIINASVKYNRKVAITGRSMSSIVKAAIDLGYMNIPEGTIIDVTEIGKYNPEQITIVTTGSQGEPMSALYRMAFGVHSNIELGSDDMVIISAHAIPGNEKLVGNILNEMYKRGVSVFHDRHIEIHVSGHACREELKLMHVLTKPKYFIPIHGEYRMLVQHREIAKDLGEDPKNIFILDNGQVLEFDRNVAAINGTVPSGRLLIDGSGVGDVGNIVLRDRKTLSRDGIIIVVASVDMVTHEVIAGPDIVSRGFVYVRESEELMEYARNICYEQLCKCLDNDDTDWTQIKNAIKDELAKFVFQKTKRKPMILPIIMNV